MKRSPIKAMSSKRRKENAERKRLMEEKFGPRDEWTCQIARMIGTSCFGPIAGHEILKRSRGGSITDMDNVVLACARHNGWVEDNPERANELGLADHSWICGIRKDFLGRLPDVRCTNEKDHDGPHSWED